jgi:hypothetical protein
MLEILISNVYSSGFKYFKDGSIKYICYSLDTWSKTELGSLLHGLGAILYIV